MTKKRGFAFEFNLPEGWVDDSSGQQVVAHGPRDEELIVSGSIVTGRDAPERLKPVRDAILRNAFQAVEEATVHPDLEVTKALSEEDGPAGLSFWILDAQTTDGEVVFLQGIVASQAAVMIVTMEGANQDSTRLAFRRFLQGVRPSVTH